MERAEKRTVVAVARAADSLGMIRADDWVEIATQMVGHGADDGPIVDLAILSKPTSRWSTELPVAAVCELLDIAEPAPEEATLLVARALADDLRARPEPAVAAPMVRMIARLAAACDYDSALANECSYAEEFLDCDCLPKGIGPGLELRLEGLPTLGLPDALVRPLASTARASLAASQPHHGH
ncbi:MAG TPA: hypothetical protein PK428_07240 [Phycicoccus sp.]|nr:hypothetical protein [Phycicoccus sp.]